MYGNDQMKPSTYKVKSGMPAVLRTMLIYSIMMLSLPVTLYFVTRYFLEFSFGWQVTDSYLYAAGVAVFTVHVILALCVYQVYKEPEESFTEKQD